MTENCPPLPGIVIPFGRTHVMFGWGFPVAPHDNVTVSPSLIVLDMVVFKGEIEGGTARRGNS